MLFVCFYSISRCLHSTSFVVHVWAVFFLVLLLFRLSFDLDLSVLFRAQSQNITEWSMAINVEWKQQHTRNDEIGTIELFFRRLHAIGTKIFSELFTHNGWNKPNFIMQKRCLSLSLHWFVVSFVLSIRHSSCSCSCLCSLNGIFFEVLFNEYNAVC